MSQHQDRYSRFVFQVKVFLPLIAVSLLLSLFWFDYQNQNKQHFIQASTTAQEQLKDSRLTGVEYAGVVTDTLSARATTGQIDIDQPNKNLKLSQGFKIILSNDWILSGENIEAFGDKKELATDSSVLISGPFGTIHAQSLRLTQNPQNKKAYLVHLQGGVKMVYTPTK